MNKKNEKTNQNQISQDQISQDQISQNQISNDILSDLNKLENLIDAKINQSKKENLPKTITSTENINDLDIASLDNLDNIDNFDSIDNVDNLPSDNIPIEIDETSKDIAYEKFHSDKIVFVEISKIETDEGNFEPLNKEELEKLKNSILHVGLIYPVVLTKKNGSYTIIDGRNRIRALKELNIDIVPAIIINNQISKIPLEEDKQNNYNTLVQMDVELFRRHLTPEIRELKLTERNNYLKYLKKHLIKKIYALFKNKKEYQSIIQTGLITKSILEIIDLYINLKRTSNLIWNTPNTSNTPNTASYASQEIIIEHIPPQSQSQPQTQPQTQTQTQLQNQTNYQTQTNYGLQNYLEIKNFVDTIINNINIQKELTPNDLNKLKSLLKEEINNIYSSKLEEKEKIIQQKEQELIELKSQLLHYEQQKQNLEKEYKRLEEFGKKIKDEIEKRLKEQYEEKIKNLENQILKINFNTLQNDPRFKEEIENIKSKFIEEKTQLEINYRKKMDELIKNLDTLKNQYNETKNLLEKEKQNFNMLVAEKNRILEKLKNLTNILNKVTSFETLDNMINITKKNLETIMQIITLHKVNLNEEKLSALQKSWTDLEEMFKQTNSIMKNFLLNLNNPNNPNNPNNLNNPNYNPDNPNMP